MRGIRIVAINDLAPPAQLAHLFKYDSAHGIYPGEVAMVDNKMSIGRQKIFVYQERDPSQLPWRKHRIDLVLECTGVFRTYDSASGHLEAGARTVLISAPPKDSKIPSYVRGINENKINLKKGIVSNASCTTNCLAPIIRIINEKWGITMATMGTIHSYTQNQRLQDAPHKDLRRARAAAVNIVPTTTGAGKAVESVYPKIKGKLFAQSYRVPHLTGSLIELFCILKKPVTDRQVNSHFKRLSAGKYQGIIEFTEAPLVSTDIVGNAHSAIFDSLLTEARGKYLKIVAWYDNEAGYSARLADMALHIGTKLK